MPPPVPPQHMTLSRWLLLIRQMQQQGIRRLLVISGAAAWCGERAHHLSQQIDGDWLWLGDKPEHGRHCSPRACKTLLGREIQHAIFDAREGMDIQALAILAGTLTAGSLLLLLTPPWADWQQLPDNDSIRWNDAKSACATPNFIHHLQRSLTGQGETLFWRQGEDLCLPVPVKRACWQPASGAPLISQQNILQQLMCMDKGIAVISAPRGRGKSALAGMLIARWPGWVIVTAPSRTAGHVIAAHAGKPMQFMAPDILLAQPPEQADWLIIDEAAALPGSQLQRLTNLYPRNLLTTTVQGYEGTGRGFLLKFCAGIPGLRHYRLNQPVRWAESDPLEQFINQMLLLTDQDYSATAAGDYHLISTDHNQWRHNPQQMTQLYHLLTCAHYRTSPLDLRRMMDAQGQRFILATSNNQVVAALWLVEEGGLPVALSRAIWTGNRRPAGNLVAQSLAAHGVNPQAACLKGLRISRIAVHPARRRQGIGSQLIASVREQLTGYDYLSVSFGYTPSLWRFWQHCGFSLVRIGSQREASSGCYNAMALWPVSQQGQHLMQQAHHRLRRDAGYLPLHSDEPLPVLPLTDFTLDDNDWLALAGFAFARRALAVSTGCLHRLLQLSELPLPALRAQLQMPVSGEPPYQQISPGGRKVMLAHLRTEAAQALQALDPDRSQMLYQQILLWQSGHTISPA